MYTLPLTAGGLRQLCPASPATVPPAHPASPVRPTPPVSLPLTSQQSRKRMRALGGTQQQEITLPPRTPPVRLGTSHWVCVSLSLSFSLSLSLSLSLFLSLALSSECVMCWRSVVFTVSLNTSVAEFTAPDCSSSIFCKVYFAEEFQHLRELVFPSGENRSVCVCVKISTKVCV